MNDEPHAYAGLSELRATEWEYVIGKCRCGWLTDPRETEKEVKALHRQHYRREYWWRFASPHDPEAQALRDRDMECRYVRSDWSAAAGWLGSSRHSGRNADTDWHGDPDIDGKGAVGSGQKRPRPTGV